MSSIILRPLAAEKLMKDPRIKRWLQDRSGCETPILRYHQRSYSTARDGTITEHGNGFSLTTIDPNEPSSTKDIVIKSVAVANGFVILVGGDESIMSGSFSIGWSWTFTYEPRASG